jgi:hypothetical protein
LCARRRDMSNELVMIPKHINIPPLGSKSQRAYVRFTSGGYSWYIIEWDRNGRALVLQDTGMGAIVGEISMLDLQGYRAQMDKEFRPTPVKSLAVYKKYWKKNGPFN